MTDQSQVSDRTSEGSTEDVNVDNVNDPSNQDPSGEKTDDNPYKRDMFKFKERYKQTEAEKLKLEQKVQELESARLKEKEDFKSLYEAEKERREGVESKLTSISQNLAYDKKFTAVYPALKKAGLQDSAEKYLSSENFDELELETTSGGRYVVHGVDTYVNKYKEENPILFSKPQAPRINSTVGNNPDLSTKPLTAADVNRYENEYRKNPTEKNKQTWVAAFNKFRNQ